MEFTKQQYALININIKWAFMCGFFEDPYDMIEAYENPEYVETNMVEFRKMKKNYEETYNEHLTIDNNFSMSWGTHPYGFYTSLNDFLDL